MLEWKYFLFIGMEFPFIVGNVYKVIRYQKELRLMEVNTLYSEVYGGLFYDRNVGGIEDVWVSWPVKR